MNDSYTTTPLARLQIPAIAIALIAIIACVVGAMADPDQFFRSYLFGYIFWLEIAIGSLALLSIQYLTGGVWGMLLRRNYESGVRTLPILAALFLPIAFGIHRLYGWTHPEHVKGDPVLEWKTPYLNEQFFYIRAAIYFIVWCFLALRLVKLARDHEDTLSPWTALKMRRTSAGTLVFLALSLTFAAVDWVMSLEPHWFSTMYGINFMVGSLLSAHAVAILVLVRNSRLPGVLGAWTKVHFRDIGNLLLAFTMLWAYTNFCQFLLIWYGNLREETPWYIRRSQGAWLYVAVALLILHFFVPFFMLLNRPMKEKPGRLAFVAILLLFMHFVDLFWVIMPAFYQKGFHIHWLDIAAPLAIGGVWFFFYLGYLKRRPLLPTHEPYVREALSHV
jgi:hypothetical protein